MIVIAATPRGSYPALDSSSYAANAKELRSKYMRATKTVRDFFMILPKLSNSMQTTLSRFCEKINKKVGMAVYGDSHFVARLTLRGGLEIKKLQKQKGVLPRQSRTVATPSS
jgi:hypothetical protein